MISSVTLRSPRAPAYSLQALELVQDGRLLRLAGDGKLGKMVVLDVVRKGDANNSDALLRPASTAGSMHRPARRGRHAAAMGRS